MSELIERIRLNCHCCEDTGCWTWKRFSANGKHPKVGINGVSFHVKKIMWIEYNQKQIHKKCVFAICGNTLCVNPKHLKVRTRSDMVKTIKISAAGLANIAASNRRRGKLDEEKVRLIREMDATEKQLSEMFSISQTLVGMVRRYEVWKPPQSTPFAGLFKQQQSRK